MILWEEWLVQQGMVALKAMNLCQRILQQQLLLISKEILEEASVEMQPWEVVAELVSNFKKALTLT